MKTMWPSWWGTMLAGVLLALLTGCAGTPTHIATSADTTPMDCGPFPEQYEAIARSRYLENESIFAKGAEPGAWQIRVDKPVCTRLRVKGDSSQDAWVLTVHGSLTGPGGTLGRSYPMGIKDGKVVWDPTSEKERNQQPPKPQ